MRPATPLMRLCPKCRAPFREARISSFNTIGLERYTDGKVSGPYVQDFHRLCVCPECSLPVWLEDAVKLGEFRGYSTCPIPAFLLRDCPRPVQSDDVTGEGYHPDPEWEATKYCRDPALGDYLSALEEKGIAREREIYLRIELFWLANDRARLGRTELELPQEARANIYALFNLLDDADEHERLLKAEAARELGQFELAVTLLTFPFRDRDLECDASVITELARQKTALVKRFPIGSHTHG